MNRWTTCDRNRWIKALLSLVGILVCSGGAGTAGAYWLGSSECVRSSLAGWLLTSSGVLLSWLGSWWFAGPLVGLFHVASGFLLRAVGPLAAAAVLLHWETTQPSASSSGWEAGGLLWWTFGYYLLGLVVDTALFLRTLQQTDVGSSGLTPASAVTPAVH